MTVNKQLGDATAIIAKSCRRLVICGALAWTLLVIINQLPLDVAELTFLPLAWQDHPEKIVPGIKSQVKAARETGLTPLVMSADCDTSGYFDTFRGEENIVRTPGPHCYQTSAGGSDFDATMDQEPVNFFLTNYMVRHFERIVMKGIGLGYHSHLRDTYRAHDKRL